MRGSGLETDWRNLGGAPSKPGEGGSLTNHHRRSAARRSRSLRIDPLRLRPGGRSPARAAPPAPPRPAAPPRSPPRSSASAHRDVKPSSDGADPEPGAPSRTRGQAARSARLGSGWPTRARAGWVTRAVSWSVPDTVNKREAGIRVGVIDAADGDLAASGNPRPHAAIRAPRHSPTHA